MRDLLHRRLTVGRIAVGCVALLAAAVAFALLRTDGRRATPSRAGLPERSSIRPRTPNADEGQDGTSVFDLFKEGFGRWTVRACEESMRDRLRPVGGDCDDPSTMARFARAPDLELERAEINLRSGVHDWLDGLGLGTTLPPGLRIDVPKFLADEMRGPRAPFSSVVALLIARRWGGPSVRDALRSLVAGGDAVPRFLRLQALEVMYSQATAEDLDLLTE